ncbi:MAG: glycosyltransferase family 2 protein [Sterolibacteriaceae bacterium]|uniref:Glycosyltransferase family 2 protein n=1 Tax=Candidatus Methylophosphatis roskildensis TaxID=2899263 RepID=A0A9D7HTM6_9PROT|nr:glycosyltransferase family 2 protein [Candidatus Methylophosphatis roskildensis]MBK7237768.1 glycosyltransferase family 2 protein [Sterolibacteriaceae bacterium]
MSLGEPNRVAGSSDNSDSLSVVAIIVSWNSGEWLIPCVQALSEQSHSNLTIAIWDNASSGPTLAVLDQISDSYPMTRIFRSDANLGFAGGNNRAAEKYPDTNFILTVNPDALLDHDSVRFLVRAAATDEHCGAIGVTQMSPDGLYFDGIGDCYNPSGIAWRGMHGQPARALGSAPRKIISPCAAIALYRTSAFAACGGFDEDFFCYMEDVDLGFRLQLAGWHCLHVPDAKAIHFGASATGSGSDFSAYHGHRNMIWVFCKNMPGVLFWLFLPLHLVANLASIAVLVARGKPGIAYRAKIDALRGLPAMLGKRRAIQRRRKVSILTILQKLTFKLQAGQLFR